VRAIACVHDYIKSDPSERGVRPKPMNSDMKNVDVFGCEDAGQLM
jgi:hypothetical protein